MATEPIFTATPVIGMVQVSTGNTARDGSGTLGTVITGGTNGTRITRITIQATGNTTAGIVRLYIGDNAGTPVIKLWKEVLITTATVSATVSGFTYTLELLGERALILPPDYTLRAAPHNAETFAIYAEGGNY
jgi:hypothetical protein